MGAECTGNRAGLFCVAVLLVAGCGGGTAKTDAGGGSGGAEVSSECANVACLQHVEDLMIGCAADGTCVYQADVPAVPGTTTKCYENGVTIQEIFGGTSPGSTGDALTSAFKVENNGSLCYTRSSVSVTTDVDAGAGTRYTSDTTMQDASGKTIVTIHVDTGGVVTVACPGRQSSLVPASCGFPLLAFAGGPLVKSTAASTCDRGTCTFSGP